MINELKYDKNYVNWNYNDKNINIKINNVWRAKYSASQDLIAVEYNKGYKTNIILFTPNGNMVSEFKSISGRKILGLTKFKENEKIQIKMIYENGVTYICEYSKLFNEFEKIKRT